MGIDQPQASAEVASCMINGILWNQFGCTQFETAASSRVLVESSQLSHQISSSMALARAARAAWCTTQSRSFSAAAGGEVLFAKDADTGIATSL